MADKGDSQRAIWAQRLRSRRTELNISQEELADLVHSNQATISRWENSHGEQSLELLVELARVLEASTDWLLGLTDEVGTTAHSQAQLDELEQSAIRAIRGCTPGKRALVVEILKTIAEVSSCPDDKGLRQRGQRAARG